MKDMEYATYGTMNTHLDASGSLIDCDASYSKTGFIEINYLHKIINITV